MSDPETCCIYMSLMKWTQSVCPIFIGSDGHIDTSEHEPDAGFDTASRVLQVSNLCGIIAAYT